jgi:hypothetical protein
VGRGDDDGVRISFDSSIVVFGDLGGGAAESAAFEACDERPRVFERRLW